MAKLLKVVTTANAKKHFFDIGHIIDLATATSGDRRLSRSISTVFNGLANSGRGLYSEAEKDRYTNAPDLFIGTLSDTPAHPNGQAFSFNVTDWWATIAGLNIDEQTFATTDDGAASGVFRIPASLITLLDEDGDDITLAAAEAGFSISISVSRTAGSNVLTASQWRVADFAPYNLLNQSREVRGIRIADTGVFTRTSSFGSGTVRLAAPYRVNFNPRILYSVKTITPNDRGYGFGTPSTARFTFTKGTVTSNTAHVNIGADVTFGVEAFQRQNIINLTLAGVTGVKEIKLSEDRWEEELGKWLNKGSGRGLANVVQGFHIIKEDE